MSLIWLWTITVCVSCIEMHTKLSNKTEMQTQTKWNSFHVVHDIIAKLNNKFVGLHSSLCIPKMCANDVLFLLFCRFMSCCCTILSALLNANSPNAQEKCCKRKKHCDIIMLKPFTIGIHMIIITDNRTQRLDHTRWNILNHFGGPQTQNIWM